MAVNQKHKSTCLVRSSINIDQMFAVPHVVRPGETLSSTEMQSRPGGKGANVSVAVALAGQKVIMSGAVGKDAEWPIDELEKRGVTIDKIHVYDHIPTGRAFIQVAKDGENSIVLLKGANFYPNQQADDPKNVFESCASSHTPITHLILQNEIPLETTKAFLSHAHQQSQTRCISVFNPSPMLAEEEVRKFAWNQVDVLIVNEGEGEDLLKALGANKQDVDVLDTLASVSQLKEINYIVMTKGSRGSAAYVRPFKKDKSKESQIQRTRIDVSASKPKQVIDTTGAGDTFAGNLVAGLMRLHDTEEGLETDEKEAMNAAKEVLRWAGAAAAMAVEKNGAMESIPKFKDVQKREKELLG